MKYSLKRLNTILLILLCTGFVHTVMAQELAVRVSITADNLNTADKSIIEDMKQSFSEFFNNTVWTEDQYENIERIKANLNVVILEDPAINKFIASFTLQSERPVYNSNYLSTSVNIKDKKVEFTYLPKQTIEKTTTSYYDHISSVLSFYAYTILAYDYDSFSQFGGDDYFNHAQDIMNAIPTAVRIANKSWDIDGKNNKSVMVKNMLDPRFRPYRQALYEYHRMGLDNMYKDAEKSKAVLLSTLNIIGEVNESVPNSTALQMFADSKREELVEIFKKASKGQQKKVYRIMVKVDPSQASKYIALK